MTRHSSDSSDISSQPSRYSSWRVKGLQTWFRIIRMSLLTYLQYFSDKTYSCVEPESIFLKFTRWSCSLNTCSELLITNFYQSTGDYRQFLNVFEVEMKRNLSLSSRNWNMMMMMCYGKSCKFFFMSLSCRISSLNLSLTLIFFTCFMKFSIRTALFFSLW